MIWCFGESRLSIKGVVFDGLSTGVIATVFWMALNTILNSLAEEAWVSMAFAFILGMLIGIVFYRKYRKTWEVLLIAFISVLTVTTASWIINYYYMLSTIEITSFIINFLLNTAYLTVLAIWGSIISIGLST